MHENIQLPKVTTKELYQRFNILTGVLTTLMQHGERLLALAEEHPDCEPVDQLLATLRMELFTAREQMDQTMEVVDQLWQHPGTP
jgi:hypothetical protein